MPTDAELHARYQTAYQRLFAPDSIRPARRDLLAGVLSRVRRHAWGGRLLDVGCGGGHLLRAASANGWCAIGTDLSHAACVTAHQTTGTAVTQAEASALPFRDGALDVVTLV